MPIRIAICDGEREDIERLSAALSSYDPSFEILAFQSGKALVDEFLDGKILQCYGKLDEMPGKLPGHSFIRCRQSFLANIRRITEMGDSYFRLGPSVIGISKKYLKPAKDAYIAYLFTRMDGGAAP